MKEVKVGIVGIGRLGSQHAENLAYRIQNCKLTAVCSIREEEVKNAQDKWDIPYSYTDYDKMLENKDLDAIFISSPSSNHCHQIKKALEAGFHVFSEKPLGLYLDEAYDVREKVNKFKDQIFMLGFMRRYDQSYLEAKHHIDEGAIGEPIYIRCYGLDPAKQMDRFLKYAKKNDSGGLFLDMAIHDFDLARWYLGTEARKVWAIGGNYTRPEFAEIKDIEMGSAMVHFENGAIGTFVASRNCVHGYHIETEIIGSKGSLRIGTLPERNQVVLLKECGVVQECFGGFLERFDQAYLNEVEEFINCIIEGRKPLVTVDDGVESTKLGYACKQSLESDKLVRLIDIHNG